MSASRRRAAKAPLPGDAVHLGQVLCEVRIVNGELRGFPIPAHPTPVVKVMLKQGLPEARSDREMQAIKIIRASHAAAQLILRGRADRDEQANLLATKLGVDYAMADVLIQAYVQS